MRKIIKATATVGGMTMISRVLGFVRDMVIARFFGASAGADAFFVAFKIPNFFRRLFAEGAFSQAFVPVLAETKEKRGIEAVRHLVGAIAFRLGLILLLLTLFGVFGASLWMSVFAPGFRADPEKFELATAMLQITFPYLMLISLVALSSALMNTYNKFAVPAFTPVWLNLVLIGCAIWLAPHLEQPVMALAWGVLLAGIVQLMFHLPFLWQMGLLPSPTAKSDPGVGEVKRLMLPALFGVSVAQINLLVDTILASFLVTGSVSWLYYSDRLMEFPLGVFGVALATVVLPGLSKKAANADWEGFKQDLDFALKLVALIALPAMVGLFLLAQPLLVTLFFYGEFTAFDVLMSSQSLMAYSLGLLGFILVKVLAPAFYARKEMKTPVKIAVVALVSNIILNLILIGPLAHVGLALATSISAMLNAGLLYYFLLKQDVFSLQTPWRGFSLQVVSAVIVMAVVLILLNPGHQAWLSFTAGQRVVELLILILCAILAYAATLILLGFRPRRFMDQFKAKE
ncbi:murein biosynthesis integral membrane protein MurJ [Thiomicrospira microaerophila]|uniref:murein biosynthesis integral membrane protein MurJ n=1 Tax=Thiomicrospira microaerophila TaxID=406020 RepID=UPI00200CC6ED|nr:murein biosynthesis integral membrane protein MurJ [Thiomicrospira microaerophila]UQB41534.1 murein biosynthesis integral membrane protein MurJ [Thiomicrospira microaerophila]